MTERSLIVTFNRWLPRCLAIGLALAVSVAAATDLRGRIDIRHPSSGYVFPGAGKEVWLLSWDGRSWTQRVRAITGSDGMYYFAGVPPGSHVLSVMNRNYRIDVLNQRFQDISPLIVQ